MRTTPGPLVVVFGLLCGAAYSQTPSLPASAPSCSSQADGFLQARLPSWQSRLLLNDWKVTLLISPESELKPNTLGNIHWDVASKTATIRVLHASGYTASCSAALKDMENTVVHELVHLELSGLPRSTDTRKDEENAVVRITAALLQLGGVGSLSADSHPVTDPAKSSADRKIDATHN